MRARRRPKTGVIVCDEPGYASEPLTIDLEDSDERWQEFLESVERAFSAGAGEMPPSEEALDPETTDSAANTIRVRRARATRLA